MNGTVYECKDVNLDSEFIVEVSKELLIMIGYKPDKTAIQYKKY